MTERQHHALLDLRRRRRELAIESGIVVLGAFGLLALAAPCPRCGGAFFTSWERLLISLPWLHGSCAHCGQGLAPERRS